MHPSHLTHLSGGPNPTGGREDLAQNGTRNATQTSRTFVKAFAKPTKILGLGDENLLSLTEADDRNPDTLG